MSRLSKYHYVIIAVGSLAGLFILGTSLLFSGSDSSESSMRYAIEVTQTHWQQENAGLGLSVISTYVADDLADGSILVPMEEFGNPSDDEGHSEEDAKLPENTLATATASIVLLPSEGNEKSSEGTTAEQVVRATPTVDPFENLNSGLGETSAESAISDEQSFSSDHRYREDWWKWRPNRRRTATPTQEPTLKPSNTPTTVPTNTATTVFTRTPTNTTMPTNTYTPTKTSTPTKTATPSKTATPLPTNTLTPLPTATTKPTEEPVQDIYWSAGFETGDISEWTEHGGWIHQGTTPKYEVQSSIVHTGEHAVKFTINTSSKTAQAAYLFYWDTLPQAAYYSAWYYIPQNIDTQHWWNIMQWKSTYNGNSDYSRPVFVIDGALFGRRAISLCHLPDKDTDKVCWRQEIATLPTNQWVHIEVYYERDKVDGRVIVWQDGVQLFDISGYPTVLSDGTLHWSVNHYSDDILPNPSSIYLDDVVIAHSPVGH